MSTSLHAAARPGIAYENQLLGAFIYALGYESGRTGKPLPVNLFQQTPLDGTFGDLIAGGGLVCGVGVQAQLAGRTLRTRQVATGQPPALSGG